MRKRGGSPDPSLHAGLQPCRENQSPEDLSPPGDCRTRQELCVWNVASGDGKAHVQPDLLPGMLTGDAKWGAFYGCDAFMLPSHQENFGLVVAEALACGKKVFLSRQVNIWREIVEDGVGMAAPDTLEGTVQLVQSAFEYSASPRKVALDARKTFDNRFQIANTAQMFVEEFARLEA